MALLWSDVRHGFLVNLLCLYLIAALPVALLVGLSQSLLTFMNAVGHLSSIGWSSIRQYVKIL